MQTIELKKGLSISFDDLILGLSRLDLQELTAFFEKLNQQLSLNEPPAPQQRQEILLLKQIRTILPRSVMRRYKALKRKQYEQPLSQPEQAEILGLIEFIEQKTAERVYLLGALAKLRQIPITELVQQLNLRQFHG
jgi:hypothetical protein